MKDPLPSENDKDEAPTPPLMQDTLQLIGAPGPC